MNSCAVTNESVLLPGVTVHPEAVLGVHTLGRPGQVFPPHSITQGELCLFPGHDLEGGKPYVEPEGPNPKAVSAYVYWRYNILYWLATCAFVPLTSFFRDMPMVVTVTTGLYFGGILLGLAAIPVAAVLALFTMILYMAAMKK